MKTNKALLLVLGLTSFTLLSGLALSSSSVSADDDSVIDEVNIVVPTSCTMSGTGMQSHTATINNGTYASDIGTTTFDVYCNDKDGFAVYAIGYTDDTDGKNVLTSSTLGSTQDIVTGTNTSGNSQWAMKLSTQTSPEPDYPITIENNYNNYHTVPDDYELVAKRTASTDIGAAATGSSFTSTYQVFISSTQLAGTYLGQVKYVLVHPNYVDSDTLKDAVTVVFDGNGLTFPNGQTTNTVKYASVCKPSGYGYVGPLYDEVVTPHPYTDNEHILETITVPNADKIKVIVDYGITGDTAYMTIAKGIWAGWDEEDPPEPYYDIYSSTNMSGSETFIIEGDIITIESGSWATPESEYNYGFYAKIYPVYDTEQPGTTEEELPSDDCSIVTVSGTYMETTTWKGKWIAEIPYEDCYWDSELQDDVCTTETNSVDFLSYDEISDYVMNNYESLKGTTITLTAYNPYNLIYNGNGASNEFGMGIHKYYDEFDGGYMLRQDIASGQVITLLAPNYKRTGYGFVGWSLDQNAASHLSTANLYGPNETITIDQNMMNSANNSREIIMYAIWLPSAGNLQNWSGCSNMSVGDVTALTDTRDNDTYAVAKLTDGNCWMIENLRLGGDSPITLTVADTQSAGTLPAASNTTWSSNWEAQQVSTISTSSPESLVDNVHQKTYAYGNNYSWYAAANRTELITTNFGTDEVFTTSICAAGWKLPSESNYSSLLGVVQGASDVETSNNLRSYPYNYVFSGFIAGSEIQFDNYSRQYNGRKIYGHTRSLYWSSTASRNTSGLTYIYRLELMDSSVTVSNGHPNELHYGYGGWPNEGYAVRCMLSNAN